MNLELHSDRLVMASRRVLEKIGFLNSGTMHCYGKESPFYRITRSEWARLDRSA